MFLIEDLSSLLSESSVFYLHEHVFRSITHFLYYSFRVSIVNTNEELTLLVDMEQTPQQILDFLKTSQAMDLHNARDYV